MSKDFSSDAFNAAILAEKALFGHFVRVPFEMPMVPLPDKNTDGRLHVRKITKNGKSKKIRVPAPNVKTCLGVPAAYLFSYLVGHRKCVKPEEILKNKGWFYCASKKIESDIGFKPGKQQILLNLLKEVGFVSIKMTHEGNASHRWFWLHISKALEAITCLRKERNDDMIIWD